MIDDPTAQVVTAWLRAGEDLGVRVVAPYELPGAGGPVQFLAHLPDFGSRNGMVLCRLGGMPMQHDDDVAAAKAANMYYSLLNPVAYSSYNREQFIDTLNDWGYFGPPDTAPAWYTGDYWGQSDNSSS